MQSLSQFGGLQKHQNNPTCTKTNREGFHSVEVGHYAVAEEIY